MAGAKQGQFLEVISLFLRAKIAEVASTHGPESHEYAALVRQYVRSPLEDEISPLERRRHYESEVRIEFEGRLVKGVERLYRRTILIEPTTVCAAHCRWCLRGQYPVQTMSADDIEHSARYIGSPELRGDIDEILITGGDPLMSLPLLRRTLTSLREHAPNVRIVRIGSRVPFQDPQRINEAMLELFLGFKEFRFELGVNVNHPIEFWPESIASLKRLMGIGFRVYNQHPLLKGVNDNLETLVELYDGLREHGVEAHYLFHAIPMRGMSHHRTSVKRGLELANAISSCGLFSGRAKPRYAVLSDIGKIVLYEGTILDRRVEDNALLLRSGFQLADRLRWNPGWSVPASCVVEPNGQLLTWYADGTDDTAREWFPQAAANVGG